LLLVDNTPIAIERPRSWPFVSILSAHGVRLEDISDLVGHCSTSATETQENILATMFPGRLGPSREPNGLQAPESYR
jgi:hypothetical protein